MCALLQSVNKKNKVLIFTETGAGKPVTKIVETQSLILNFFAQELGFKIDLTYIYYYAIIGPESTWSL